MTCYSADYVLGAVTLVAAVLGLFGGFSGALGFCAGVIAAGIAVRLGHPFVCGFVAAQWGVAAVMLCVSLVSFGLARMIVKRVVRGLLAQPADAVFGFLVAAVTGAGASLAALFAANRFLGMQLDSTVYSLAIGFLGLNAP